MVVPKTGLWAIAYPPILLRLHAKHAKRRIAKNAKKKEKATDFEDVGLGKGTPPEGGHLPEGSNALKERIRRVVGRGTLDHRAKAAVQSSSLSRQRESYTIRIPNNHDNHDNHDNNNNHDNNDNLLPQTTRKDSRGSGDEEHIGATSSPPGGRHQLFFCKKPKSSLYSFLKSLSTFFIQS